MMERDTLFGDRLQSFREWRKLTRAQLAKLTQTSLSNIWRWENGKTWPRIEAVVELCMAMDISADAMLGLGPGCPACCEKETDEATIN